MEAGDTWTDGCGRGYCVVSAYWRPDKRDEDAAIILGRCDVDVIRTAEAGSADGDARYYISVPEADHARASNALHGL